MLYDPVAFGILDDSDADVMATLSQIDLNGGATLATRDEWLRSFVDYWGGQGAWQACANRRATSFVASAGRCAKASAR